MKIGQLINRKWLINIWFTEWLVSFLFPLLIISLLIGCSSKSLEFRQSNKQLQASCWDNLRLWNQQQNVLDESLDEQIFRYQELVEELLVNREKALRLIGTIDTNKVIPPADLDALNIRMKTALELVDQIVEVIDQNRCWYEVDGEYLQQLGLLPLNDKLRLKGTMLELSGGLLLYDSYQAIVAVINEDDRIRRFLNQSDVGYGIQQDQLAAMTVDFLDIDNLSNINDKIASYQQSRKLIPAENFEDDNLAYLDLLIRSSTSFEIFQELTPDELISRRISNQNNTILDNLNALNRSAVNGVSGLFGNAVGIVEIRKGKLYEDKRIEQYLLEQLQGGDILLEKTPFRLTDKMIPGHWGHAAIWVGNEKELRALGIWDDPLVKKYHQQIQDQQLVVEALRDGTKMNRLADFMNIDDLLILRDKQLSNQEKIKIIKLTLRQVGKPYDFNYDVETTDKIVCSQLVYLAYTGIDWPTDTIAGRYTISPDNIARKGLPKGELDIIMLYHDGKLVESNRIDFMNELLTQANAGN